MQTHTDGRANIGKSIGIDTTGIAQSEAVIKWYKARKNSSKQEKTQQTRGA